MELEIATLLIFFIILILWEIKADFVLLIFGFAAYLFLLFYIGTSDPLGIFLSIVDFLILNPLGIILLIIPLVLIGVFKFRKQNDQNA